MSKNWPSLGMLLHAAVLAALTACAGEKDPCVVTDRDTDAGTITVVCNGKSETYGPDDSEYNDYTPDTDAVDTSALDTFAPEESDDTDETDAETDTGPLDTALWVPTPPPPFAGYGTGADADGDGWFDSLDCDDNDPATHPGAPELCDGIDNNCNGVATEELADDDLDEWSECDGDCNDRDWTVNPAALELCDGIDNNCDGNVDDGPLVSPSCNWLDNDNDGWSIAQGDCNDAAWTGQYIFPGAFEACDGIDNNCDGFIPGREIDQDGDGAQLCNMDCDDNDRRRSPWLPEVCDGVDNNCMSGILDEGYDGDADGYTVCTGDCDDWTNWIHPGALEYCDGADSNCDGTIDDGYQDSDGDGELCDSLDQDADGYTPDQGDCDDLSPLASPAIVQELCNSPLDDDCDGFWDYYDPQGCI